LSNNVVNSYRHVSAFDPNSISDLWAWYQADTSFMTLSGSNITAWNPQTDLTAKQLIADSTGVAPTTSTYNSRGIASFDGTEWMHTNDDTYLVSQPLTFAFVAKILDSQDTTIFDDDSTAGGRRILCRADATSGRYHLIDGSYFYSATVPATADAWATQVICVNGSSSFWRINGGNENTGTYTDTINPLTIFANYSGNFDATGDLMHFIMYTKAVTGTELTDLESWMATEAGI